MTLDFTRRFVPLAACLLFADVTAVMAEAPAGPPKGCDPCRASDLVELVKLDPTIKLDIRYATPDNFVGKAVYPEARAFLQRPAAEALLSAHRWLKEQGYGLVIYDAYRPWSVTKLFWDITPPDQRIFVADPSTGSVHNRGCAVDVGLFELRTGRIVEMPGAYDEMTERSFVTYMGAAGEQRARRDLLRKAMEQDGYFFVLPEEWWHYDFKDFRDYAIENIPFSAIRPAAADSAGPTITPGAAYQQAGGVVHSPNEAGWYLGPSSELGITFGRQLGAAGETAVARTIVFKVEGYDKDREFFDYIAGERERQDDKTRFRVLSVSNEVVTFKGTSCLKFSGVSEDHGSKGVNSRKFQYLKTTGYVCRHPADKDIAFQMEISHRGNDQAIPAALLSIGAQFFDDIQFTDTGLNAG